MKHFGSAVKATLPQEQPWIFQYFNWWRIVTYEGTEKQCLKEQNAVENAAWAEYCNGYGPDEKLTVYIGPKYQAVCEFSHGDGSLETFEGSPEECISWIQNHPESDNPAYTLWKQKTNRFL